MVNSTTSYYEILVKDQFCKYIAGDFGIVKMGNKNYSWIVRIRDISIKANVGYILVLKYEFQVPNL